MSKEESMRRHPSGKKSVWDLAWALGKAKELGGLQRELEIIKLLEEGAKKYQQLAGQAPTFVDGIPMRGMAAGFRQAIALIKGDVTERLQNKMSPNGYTEGENKPKHTPCCDDWDCYGCEACDCPDCLKGENK